MPPINYVGEHLWVGYIIHAAVILGFLASLNAFIAFFRSARTNQSNWLQYARYSFLAQSIMVWVTVGLLFYAMIHHFYEYEYVRHHISDDLKFKYIFAAFWEGQEGSFLLWMFWNVVLGLILIKTSKQWESPVMGILSLLQVFLFSMLLGLYLGWGEHIIKIGSSPSLLVRETYNAPLFQNPDYVSLIKGNGLNPLLQNYWMTIHPPTLFFGFAATIVPFLFAFAGWYKKESRAWLKPAQEWALFSSFILGLGILMGGAWAYEALSFGGYWAWDPVENMSLVPWIMLVAGLHTNMIARATHRAIGTTYLYYLLAFILVLYSTYLTRSGVLGDSSVHAFTDMGLEWQLVLMAVVFAGIGMVLFFRNKKYIEKPTEEDKINSREYWMFIGAMILLFSAVLITSSTSLPVFNKIAKSLSPSFTGQVIVDQIGHHNRYQLWIAVLVSFLSGISELLRYKDAHWDTYKSRFLKLISISLGLASIAFIASVKAFNEPSWQHFVLQFAGIFAIVTNITYLVTFLRGNLKMAGSAISHLGFGLMVLGILATGLNKQIISTNLFAQSDLIEGFKTDDYMKNLVLIKGAPMTIKDFEVTYQGDTLLDPFNREFDLRFDQKAENGTTVKSFVSRPTLVYSRSENQAPSTNPSIHRSLTKDLYTFVNWLPPTMMNREAADKSEAAMKYQSYHVAVGDTFFLSGAFGIYTGAKNKTAHPDYIPIPGDDIVEANIEFHQLNDSQTYRSNPAIISREELYYTLPDLQNNLGLKVRISPQSLESFYPSLSQGHELELKENESEAIDGYTIKFLGFDKNIDAARYASKEGDIAVSARLEITTPSGKKVPAEPIFIIRKSEIHLVHDYNFDQKIRLTCLKIDPQKESVTIGFLDYHGDDSIDLEIAEKAPRNDLIVVQSILFPGINMFWFGTLLMLAGLLLSGIRRWLRKV
ncbi:MAG: cytochrome c biogenesis protein CcsA [Saprospiraceae bacterium]|nr:cytochrome c biogenesis protein CcsA [Saprospiraceae bacterium]